MLVFVKLKNALELFWDSLDTQERRLVVGMALYVAISLTFAAHSRSRQRLKDELREELSRGRV